MNLLEAILTELNPLKEIYGPPTDPRVIAALVIKGFTSLLGILFLCYIIYAGFTWMTAGGNETKIIRAKSTLTSASFGVLFIFAAYSIAQFIILAFGCATSTTGQWCLFFNNLAW